MWVQLTPLRTSTFIPIHPISSVLLINFCPKSPIFFNFFHLIQFYPGLVPPILPHLKMYASWKYFFLGLKWERDRQWWFYLSSSLSRLNLIYHSYPIQNHIAQVISTILPLCYGEIGKAEIVLSCRHLFFGSAEIYGGTSYLFIPYIAILCNEEING